MRQRSVEISLTNESPASFLKSLVLIVAQVGTFSFANSGIHEAVTNLSRYTWEVCLIQKYMGRTVILSKHDSDKAGKDRR